MNKLKRALLILGSYVLVFIVSALVFGLILNQGKVSGALQNGGASLPVVYVKAGGRLINEMHGYKEPIDAGYLRDTITPVGDSRTINLCVDADGDTVTAITYELYDALMTEKIEEGEGSAPAKTDAMWQSQMVLKEAMSSNREYVLRLLVTDSSDETINYYTRVRYGSDLKLAEKLEYVLDFNETTFEYGGYSTLESYLETSSSANTSDYSQVSIHSTAGMVTWGYMAPYRTGEIGIDLKEINTETAAFSLRYSVESSRKDMTTLYDVEEYYRIRWTDSKIYLLDFSRKMEEKLSTDQMTVESGSLRLGIVGAANVDFKTFGVDEHDFCYFKNASQIWHYDATDQIVTCVYSAADETHNCASFNDSKIKMLYADDEKGDLYFMVYGYMHDSGYEGQEGIMIYHFSYEDVMLEQLMFIPYDKSFVQLDEGISKLAYMNEEKELYLMIEQSIYRIQPDFGRMEVAHEGVDSSNCAVSSKGVLALTQDIVQGAPCGRSLRILDLNTGKEEDITPEGKLIAPLGFVEEDLIYGLVDEIYVKGDSAGVIQMPMYELHVVDEELKDIKTYSKVATFISGIIINDNSINIKLCRQVINDKFVDYEEIGEDYIIRNSGEPEQDVRIVTIKDSVRGNQKWLKLKDKVTVEPVVQKARIVDPGYNIAKDPELKDDIELKYYTYSRGTVTGSYTRLKDAIDYGNNNFFGTTIMSSHKQIVWQRAGRANVWELNPGYLDANEETSAQNREILKLITSYENMELPVGLDYGEPMFGLMTDALPSVDVVDLTGIALDDVLHFVYRDRLVVLKTGEDKFCVIVGFDDNADYIQIADPETGETSWKSWSSVKNLYEENKKICFSYLD